MPTALKVIRGNPGKRALNRHEPKPQGDLQEPPDYLTPTQQTIWREAIQHAPGGLLKQLDASIFETWVIAEDLSRIAAAKLTQVGSALLIRCPKSGLLLPSPLLGILNRQASIKIRAAAELGFSPASRARISLSPEATVNHWTELKKGS